MKVLAQIVLSAAALTLAAGCGDQRGPDGLTAEENEKLNAIAEKEGLDVDVVDASPDSLVPDNTLLATESDEATDLNAGAAAGANPASGNGL
jgi:hypothetical protein